MKKITKIISILVIIVLIVFYYKNFHQKDKNLEKINSLKKNNLEESYHSNKINGVNYDTKDLKGNHYIINAAEGEIDVSDNSVIFLKNVTALIKIKDAADVKIYSDYGKYNINNYDTIFSTNVIITYLENKITSDYADFSIGRNSLIITKNVFYSNPENTLKADVVKVNLKTKDTNIYMHEDDKKVKINGNK